MNNQNLSLYNIFHVVASHGNITSAAKELYISQPAISKSIKKLESSLKIKLFTRTSRGVHLTKEGEILYQHTKRALEELSIGEKSIQYMNDLGIGNLKIGVSTTLCKYVLLPYLNDFVSSNPHINIGIECQSTYKTLELLEKNEIDIGLVGEPNHKNNLDFFKVGKVQDIFVSTSAYLEHLKIREINSTKKLMDPIEIFKACNLMLLDEKNITRLFVDEYLNSNQIVTNQILEVTSMDLLIEFAKTGLGVACVIKDFVEPELKKGQLIEIPLENPLTERNIGFVYHKNLPQTSSVKKFIDFYKNHSL